MITGDRELGWKYRDLIIKQIKEELNPTEEELQLMRDRLNKVSSDEQERTYEAFERFGVEVIMETVIKQCRIGGKYMSKYLNNDGTLKDKEVVADIRKAADMYENGELIETRDMLLEIINAIDDFDVEKQL